MKLLISGHSPLLICQPRRILLNRPSSALNRIVSQPIPHQPHPSPIALLPVLPATLPIMALGLPILRALDDVATIDLYAPLSASRSTPFATAHFFVVAHIRYRPRLMSTASPTPPHSQACAVPLFQNVLYPCLVLVVVLAHPVCIISASSLPSASFAIAHWG